MTPRALELKVPPVALALLFALAMWLLATQVPSLAIHVPARAPLTAIAVIAGGAFVLAGVLAFRRARTTVSPVRPESSSSIVATGVYRFSRNPMYVGFLLMLAGWATHLAHALAPLFLPAFVLYMNRFQIAAEERALTAKFGAEYASYMQRVRRWL